ncbi:Eukaryotic peptide chain release factor subunit 1-2 [Capsicum annuum]|nr:Eukaryotic peptide chain release factor subunit 1-2 [Capsicum annuum]
MEKRHNYVRKAAELATQFYINPATNQPNVTGLILAGSADFKTELSQSNVFDRRLKGKILKVVDVSNGGEDGFNQAIKLSAEKLGNVKFMQEIHIIGKYFEEISRDSGKYVVGLDDTLKVLETGPYRVGKSRSYQWLAIEYSKFGCSLEFVTNKSHEGSQFCRGFGGIGAILRYKLDVRDFDEEEVYGF